MNRLGEDLRLRVDRYMNWGIFGGKIMVRELHVEHHKLNFLLKNYISKKKIQHIIGTGRSRGAFCYSFCSSGTSVTWEKAAKRGHFS